MRNGLLTLAVFILGAATLRAQSQLGRELSQLKDQQTKAVAAALEPLNRRYQASLEALLRRATQAGDLDTANAVNDELKKLGAGTGSATPGNPAEGLEGKLVGTTWTWFGAEKITFQADGKAQWKNSPVLWPWKVKNQGLRVIEGENLQKNVKFTITFDKDLKTGTIEGDGASRRTHNLGAQ